MWHENNPEDTKFLLSLRCGQQNVADSWWLKAEEGLYEMHMLWTHLLLFSHLIFAKSTNSAIWKGILLSSAEIWGNKTSADRCYFCFFDLFRSDCFATSFYFFSSYRHFNRFFFFSLHGAARKATPPLPHVNRHPLFPWVCDVATCCDTHVCTFKKNTRATWRWTADGGASQGASYMNAGPQQACRASAMWGCVPSDLKASPCWINHDKVYPLRTTFSFYLSSCLCSQSMPLRSHSRRRKRGWEERGSITMGGSVESLFPWKWQAAARGHYQFRGIDCR